MIGWLKKSPLSGASHQLLPVGEKTGPAPASFSSPAQGEVARRSPVGEGDFQAVNCSIWNDIRRALEGNSK
tara:strand:+ start:70 stop:282 length:213 start_codon:yes stop_codon:yes gene_type:complete